MIKVGDKINKLTIEEIFDSHYTTKNGKIKKYKKAKCLCECGKRKDIAVSSIEYGDTKSCGCIKSEGRPRYGARKGFGEIGGNYWSQLRHYASKHNKFDLSIEDAWNLFLQQNRKCAMTGQEMHFDRNPTDSTARIYRKDAKKDFYLENVHWVHKDITKAFRTNSSHRQWQGYEEIHLGVWNRIIDTAKDRNIEMNMTIEEAWDLFIKQDRKCALSGVPLYFHENYRTKKNNKIKGNVSLDRIDSSVREYSIENCQWIHQDLNFMKRDFGQDLFLNWCHTISDYQRGFQS